MSVRRIEGWSEQGAPTTGTWTVGDFVYDIDGTLWKCTVAGSPGTWVETQSGAYGWGFPKTTPHLLLVDFQAMEAVNAAKYLRVIGNGTITKIGVYIGTQSGNISVGVCSSPAGRANPNARKGTSGAVACPAAGWQEIALTGPVAVVDGDWFAISADNTTATFAISEASSTAAITDFALGSTAYQDTAHPIPSPPAPAAARFSCIVLVGIA